MPPFIGATAGLPIAIHCHPPCWPKTLPSPPPPCNPRCHRRASPVAIPPIPPSLFHLIGTSITTLHPSLPCPLLARAPQATISPIASHPSHHHPLNLAINSFLPRPAIIAVQTHHHLPPLCHHLQAAGTSISTHSPLHIFSILKKHGGFHHPRRHPSPALLPFSPYQPPPILAISSSLFTATTISILSIILATVHRSPMAHLRAAATSMLRPSTPLLLPPSSWPSHHWNTGHLPKRPVPNRHLPTPHHRLLPPSRASSAILLFPQFDLRHRKDIVGHPSASRSSHFSHLRCHGLPSLLLPNAEQSIRALP